MGYLYILNSIFMQCQLIIYTWA